MALPAWALGSVAQLQAKLNTPGTLSAADTLTYEGALQDGTAIVEEALGGRQIVTRGAITEYHTFNDYNLTAFYLGQWPVISITSIAESVARDYSTALVDGTDYICTKRLGKVQRISGSIPMLWLPGVRVVRAVYAAGYADRDAVPRVITNIALDQAALLLRANAKAWLGVISVTDGTGTIQRNRQAGRLIDDEVKQLEQYHRRSRSIGTPTLERDA